MSMQPLTSSQRRRQTSLRFQLTAAAGIICCLLVGVLVLALAGVERLRTKTDQTVIVVGARAQFANEVAIATLLCRRYEKDLFLNLDAPATRAVYLEQWQAAFTALQAAIERYNSLASTDQEREQVAIWRRDSQVYQSAILETERAIARGEILTPQAANLRLEPFKTPIRSLTNTSIEWVQRDNTQMLQATAEVQTLTGQFFWLLSGIGLAGVLFAVSSSIILPIRLVRPIQDLRVVTERITQGDLSARAALAGSEEISALSNSFNQMAQRISQQLTELDQSAVVHAQNEQLLALVELVRELEIPAIPILDGVLLVPLVGQLDPRRLTSIQERVNVAVYAQRTRLVILDFTGITAIDASVVHAIEQLVAALRLLGSHTIITGLNAHVAQTITESGVHFANVQIAARVQEGIAAALDHV
jgi:anti-anti-sigma regulatory factor/HAMP domain-containing protein